MRNIGHKLLLSSLVMIVGVSTACAGILVGFQHSADSVIGLRGSIGLNDWERSNSFIGGVFLPDVSHLEAMARSGMMMDENGFPLDHMITGNVDGRNIEKTVVWDRFDASGKQISNGLTD
ncbi:MAG: hypothetical protein COB78_07695 [Hyphomicrobiales bacterium]|nr:MAG: hypothetical protein COB78_07695 [Hyphomicrobiales bacterium]